ncbi:MAG TPA: class I SAM-dependent methyltransferase [Bacillota bacterium]|nr:class I SAM-dependent methyltransferase [Bacillota bacterium]
MTDFEPPNRQPGDLIDGFTRRILDRSVVHIDRVYEEYLDPELTPTAIAHDIVEATGSLAVADIGCGTGNTLRTLVDFVRLRHPDVEIQAHGLSLGDYRDGSMSAKTRAAVAPGGYISYDIGDAAAMPYDDEQFDLVLAYEAFTHFDAPDKVLTEMARIARPLGRLLFNCPLDRLVKRSPLNKAMDGLKRRGYELDQDVLGMSQGSIARVLTHLVKPGG